MSGVDAFTRRGSADAAGGEEISYLVVMPATSALTLRTTGTLVRIVHHLALATPQHLVQRLRAVADSWAGTDEGLDALEDAGGALGWEELLDAVPPEVWASAGITEVSEVAPRSVLWAEEGELVVTPPGSGGGHVEA